MIQGTLYIFSAPSGAGKSSLIKEFLTKTSLYDIQVSISYTTRMPRSGEIHGKHYFFINHDEFKKMINMDLFLEYAKIFDNYYGTSRKNIEHMLADGLDVFLDIDWQGAQQIRNTLSKVRSIFILPPSKKDLISRLRSRGQDSEEVIRKRMKKSVIEMSHYFEYDYLIINDDFHTTLNELENIIKAERLRMEHQKYYYKDLIAKLLSD